MYIDVVKIIKPMYSIQVRVWGVIPGKKLVGSVLIPRVHARVYVFMRLACVLVYVRDNII